MDANKLKKEITMATIRSYTTVEQSRKLAEILPLESADMYYTLEDFVDEDTGDIFSIEKVSFGYPSNTEIGCWSLASLLEQLPYELCDDDGNSLYLEINKEDDVYQLVYEDPYGDFESIETDRCEHFVDACYELILKLHELNLF